MNITQMNSLPLTPPKVPLQNVNADFLKGFSCSSCSFDWSPRVLFCARLQNIVDPTTKAAKQKRKETTHKKNINIKCLK